ncbi:hypothetical protein EVAR_55955_1 [Eumeta japonica]|uniref:Uncharacterized protein n=1 Tax=Eumeta variegata TaxID=151549 RepID=A0A4C1YRN8_EUMVA|nr:hypothetical protein EVAR_55955_1 [Eumeta japonica]
MKKILRNTREVRDKSRPVCTARHAPRTPAAKFRFRYNIRLKFIGTEAGAGGVNLTECFGISEPNAKTTNVYDVNTRSGVGNLRLASHMRLFGCEAAAL